MRYFLFLLFFLWTTLFARPIHIVAAENIYGDIAKTIGGEAVSVTNILSSPNTDPHLFAVDPKTATILANADLIIINDAGYDPWALPLIQKSRAVILNVAEINHVVAGSNPHLWYNLTYVQNFANILTKHLHILVPMNPQFTQNLTEFTQQIKNLQQQIASLKTKVHGEPVTATEPLAGYLFQALDLKVIGEHFQLSVMNDTEPSTEDFANLLTAITHHHVKLLVYNLQVTDPTTQKIKEAAIQAHVPVIGMTELLPENQHYIDWYEGNIRQFDVLK